MCGILCKLNSDITDEELASLANRGPEETRTYSNGTISFGFTRLAINDTSSSGMQPFHWNQMVSITNGEIYNHRDLEHRFGIIPTSGSDCEVLLPLLKQLGNPVVWAQSLDGVFASIIYDSNRLIIARDPYGVRPLYYGIDASQNLGFASEMKALRNYTNIQPFPPGHIGVLKIFTGYLQLTRYHSVPILKNPSLAKVSQATRHLYCALHSAIDKRMMTDRPIACLLSGGLDSSIIAALLQTKLKSRLKTFSIGFEGSPDLIHAKKVADWIGSDHHEIVCTPDEFFTAIPAVIAAIESADITTIRASVGNYLVAKYIREHTECKVVFNGDGSDEVFGGYLYFKNAPSDEAFEAECDRLLDEIHMFDVLRSDRCVASHGLEARTPYLDKSFVGVAKSISTRLRRYGMEKWILRQTIAIHAPDLLPEDVLWRRKEAFSDGVSKPEKSWFSEIADRVSFVSNTSYDYLIPTTKEGRYYRTIFEWDYRGGFVPPHFWMPRWTTATDPSARLLT